MMNHEPTDILEQLLKFAKEINLKIAVEGVIYRDGYDDYQVLFENRFHCEVRAKLIDVLMENPKHADTRREITFLLNHPIEFEEWEDAYSGS